MKLRIITIILCLVALTACQDDFDELTDSRLRRITFTINTVHLFDDILVGQQGDFRLGAPAVLDGDHRLRVCAYCYDSNGSLLQHKTQLFEDMTSPKQTVFGHLDKDMDYRFTFLADVVKHDPYVDYYETWYQMETRSLKDFYLFSDSRHEEPQDDVVHIAMLTAKPANQSIDVELEPLTYNGYCVLTNTNKSDRLLGYAGYVNAFRLASRSWWRRASVAYEFNYYQPTASTITMPLNLCYADSVVYLKVKSTTLTGSDSILVDIPNTERRPFVVTVDCETMTLKDQVFY